jgi:hypothetical protein
VAKMAKTTKKVSNETISLNLARLDKKTSEYALDTILVPLNVVDVEYFEKAVQYWCNVIIESKLANALNNALDKYSDGLLTEEEEEVFEIALKDWQAYIETFKSEVLEIFEENIFETIENDGFAKIYAIMILNAKSINGNEIRFNASAIDMSKISELIKGLNPEIAITDSYKKKIVDDIHKFANDNFSTNGGTLYKNINYNCLSFEKLQKELYTRCKKPMKVNRKGKGFDNQYLTAYEMAMQLLFVCLHTQGIPFVDGNKVVTVFNGSVGDTSTLSVVRKKEVNK